MGEGVMKVEGRTEWFNFQWTDSFNDTYHAIETLIVLQTKLDFQSGHNLGIYNLYYVHGVHFVKILLELYLLKRHTCRSICRYYNFPSIRGRVSEINSCIKFI